jgi:RND family efflux transporter MFP subunit
MCDEQPNKRTPGIMRRGIRALIMYLMPLVVIAGGVMGALRLYETGPQAKRRQPRKDDTLVEVAPLARTTARATVHVMGTVVASEEVVLQPRVSGEIVKLSPKFVPGGRFEAGEFILQIDPKDYELAVEQAQSQVAQAEYERKLEQGHQEIARHEWELLGAKDAASELDLELALRKPHLMKAEANVKAAEAALGDAQLDLDRTTIRAPFNAIVTTETVDVGAQVTPQTQLGMLVGTDEYWVRASIPVDQLHWIRFPDTHGKKGSPALVTQQLGSGIQGEWQGHVVRLLADLEPQGRMARVFVSVRNPLGSDASRNGLPLLIGAYVNVVIQGQTIDNVFELPRTALRDGDRVWIMNDEKQLEIRDVDIAWSNRDTVLVHAGLETGERLVVSDLPAPVAGMGLTLGGSIRPADAPEDELAYRASEDVDHDRAE